MSSSACHCRYVSWRAWTCPALSPATMRFISADGLYLCVTYPAGLFPVASQVPHPHPLGPAADRNAPVPADRHRPHLASVASEFPRRSGPGQVPHPDHAIAAAADRGAPVAR